MLIASKVHRFDLIVDFSLFLMPFWKSTIKDALTFCLLRNSIKRFPLVEWTDCCAVGWHVNPNVSSFMCEGVHVLTGNELVSDGWICFAQLCFDVICLFPSLPLRVRAVWPSSSSHGCHGQRLLRRVRRAAVAGHCCCVPWLARSPGRGYFASAPAALLLVVSHMC